MNMKKLLLADDSATIRKVVQLCFSDESFEFVAVSTGSEAVEKLRSWKPDILLVDVLLPEVDGYQLCRQAKQENRIPVLLLVGTFEPFDFGEAERSGYDTYLTKPFDTLQLVQVVKEVVSRAARQTGESGVPATLESVTLESNASGPVADAGILIESTASHAVYADPASPEAPAAAVAAEPTGLLELDLSPQATSTGFLEISDLTLPPWQSQVVSQTPQPVSEPLPSESAPAECEAPPASLPLEQEAAAVINRLLPRWVDFMRAELMEELKRQH